MKIDPLQYEQYIQKRGRIRGWDRLQRLVNRRGFRGKKLDDRTVHGLMTCVEVWLNLNDIPFKSTNRFIEIEIDEELYVLDFATSPDDRLRTNVTRSGGEYVLIKSIDLFFYWYDSKF